MSHTMKDFYKQVGIIIRENNKVLKELVKQGATKESIYIAYLMMTLSARRRLSIDENKLAILEAEAAINVDDMMFMLENR